MSLVATTYAIQSSGLLMNSTFQPTGSMQSLIYLRFYNYKCCSIRSRSTLRVYFYLSWHQYIAALLTSSNSSYHTMLGLLSYTTGSHYIYKLFRLHWNAALQKVLKMNTLELLKWNYSSRQKSIKYLLHVFLTINLSGVSLTYAWTAILNSKLIK